MVELLRRTNGDMHAAERAELGSLLGHIPWDQGDALRVLGALSETNKTRMSLRRPQQNYLTMFELGTQRDWNTIDTAVKPLGTMNAIHAMIMRLGGRCLDEHSMKFATTLWMLVTDPDIKTKDYIHKQSKLGIFKKEFKQRVGKAHEAPEYPELLPGSPSELLTKFPNIYAMQFGGTVHMVCPWSMDDLMELNTSYRCRGFGTDPTNSTRRSNQSLSVAQVGGEPMDSHRESNMFVLSLFLKPKCSPTIANSKFILRRVAIAPIGCIHR